MARMSERSLPADAVLEMLPEALLVADDGGRVVLANARAEQLLARPRAGLVGNQLADVLHDGVRTTTSTVEDDAGRLTVVVVHELGGDDRLRDHARQQEAVAALGQRALAGESPHALMREAARILAEVLDAELVEALELEPGREWFMRRGACGWDEGERVPVAGTLVGESLDRGGPVLLRDATGETETMEGARGPQEPRGVVSGVAVPMLVAGREEGAIGVFARRRREFAEDEVHFAQAVANVVASVLERRRAEGELEASYLRLQSVIDASPAAIYLKDLDGRLMVANREFERLFDLEPGEAVGCLNNDLFADPAAGEMVSAHDLLVYESGRPLEVEEAVRFDGEERLFISLKFPLRDPAGTVIGIGGVSTDVTDRTRAREERAALEARLARAQRLESVGQLAGGIAHDFNNLLSVIANYAGFLMQAVPPASQAADDVEQILAASRGANELTRRLLLFSRRRAGNPEVIDVAAVIAETELLLRRTLGDHVALRTDVEPGLGHVLADRSQLEQVLMNLAINARDAMPEGGTLTIAATTVEPAPDAIPGPAGEAVRLVVSDTGVGMHEDVLERAFEPFFTTKPSGEGTGLGLATVYGIVRGAGGHVDLRSSSGAGTDVVIHLPATRDPLPRAPGTEETAPTPARGEQVLLVEDKDAVRVLTERILADAGYSVRTARDGLEALERHGGGSADVDVLVTDIVMPGLSGRELADEMRQRRPGLPVVFVSGYTEDYVVEAAIQEGATAFVEKPFSAVDLLASVRTVLDEAGAGR